MADPVTRNRIYHVLITLILMLISLVILIPFIWMILMSFKTTTEIMIDPYGLPATWSLRNFTKLFTDPSIRFHRYIGNSVLVSIGAMIVTLVLACLGGYGFGRPRFFFKGREVVFSILLFSLMLPVQAMYIPQFVMMSKYGLLNTRWSLVLLYAAYAITISTFLLKTYFSQLPGELEESGLIDGATDLQIFFRIMLPLAKPAILTVVLINFMYFWNELLIAMTMITKTSMRTLPLAMMNFIGENGADYAAGAASLVVGMLPVMILYILLSDKFVKGMTAGAVKG